MYTDFLEHITAFMDQEDIKLEELMKYHTSFRVGGPAKIFLEVRSEEILKKIILALKERELPYFVLGNGSNLLVSDNGYDGVIVYLGKEFSEINTAGNKIIAGAAALLGKVARTARDHGLTGLEFAAGIPGSLGGGVVMNAGAYGGELSQVISSVRAMNVLGEIVILSGEELRMGYRTSIFKEETYVILEATLNLQEGNIEEIQKKMEEYTKARKEKQPLEYPSAGSTFKRPQGHFAGKLIMDAGLRGFSVGDAQVSEKHCGFVINKGNATATEIKTLMKEVSRIVNEKYNVELEPEVILLGE